MNLQAMGQHLGPCRICLVEEFWKPMLVVGSGSKLIRKTSLLEFVFSLCFSSKGGPSKRWLRPFKAPTQDTPAQLLLQRKLWHISWSICTSLYYCHKPSQTTEKHITSDLSNLFVTTPLPLFEAGSIAWAVLSVMFIGELMKLAEQSLAEGLHPRLIAEAMTDQGFSSIHRLVYAMFWL